MIVGVLGTLGVALSLVLPWRIGSVAPSGIPVAFLFDDTPAASGPSLLIVLIPLVVMLAVGALVPAASAVRVIGAIGTLIVAALFVYQLSRVTEHTSASTADLLDTGFYIAVIGALIAFVSSFLPSGSRVRRAVERRDAIIEEDPRVD
jgi:hypothetical protein